MKVDIVTKFFQFLEKKENKTPPKIVSIISDPDPFPGFERISPTVFVKEVEGKQGGSFLSENEKLIVEEIGKIQPIEKVEKVIRRIVGLSTTEDLSEDLRIVTPKVSSFVKSMRKTCYLYGEKTTPITFLDFPAGEHITSFGCKMHLGVDVEAEGEWRPLTSFDRFRSFAFIRKGTVEYFLENKLLNTLKKTFKFIEVKRQGGVLGTTFLSPTIVLSPLNLIELQDRFENKVEILVTRGDTVEYISINGRKFQSNIRITHNFLKTHLKGYTPDPPKERTGPLKASEIVKDPSSPIVSFTYGRISRSGEGKEGTWSEIAPHLTSITRNNVENVGEKLGIKWEKAYIYNLQDEAMVAVFGRDKKGNEFMFDKYGAGQAGQTVLRLGTKKIQVSKVLAGRDLPFEEN